MSLQDPQPDERPPAEVKSIADHPKFDLRSPYITVVGRGKRSQVWKGNAGSNGLKVNLNAYMDLSFTCKDEARRWAKWYAEENGLLFVETKRHGKIEFTERKGPCTSTKRK